MSSSGPNQINPLNGAFPTAYAVITPVRDEAEYITMTIESMVHQTIKPVVWVIVNDGSTDGTDRIITRYAQSNPWIKMINRQDRGVRQRGKGVVEAFYEGLRTIRENYDFLIKLDGDLSFDPDYFEALLKEFASDPLLGIAGGGVYEKNDRQEWVMCPMPRAIKYRGW